jgi:predicted unusual protein kinase regulating ubiquinone biosynthesis (AarF/ABC1/UbiB family)
LYHLCVDLGGFFLKSGQFLAKPDLVPPAWVKRLSVLQDAAPQTPFEDVKRTLALELGRPVEELFEELRERPIGSASVAQVRKERSLFVN